MLLKEFQDRQHDVVDIAKPRGLALLGVVEPTGPVDGDIVAVIQLHRATDRAAGVSLTKGVKAVKDRAVLANIEALELAEQVLLGLGRDAAEKVDVVVGVEAAEVLVPGREGLVDLHVLKKAVVGEKGVGHSDSVGLHRMALPVIVIPDLRVVEVAHFPLHAVGSRRQRVSSSIH